MENGPFEDVFPIELGIFQPANVSLPEGNPLCHFVILIKLLVPGTSKTPFTNTITLRPMTFALVSRFTVGNTIAEKDDVLHRAGKSGGSYLYVSWNCVFFLQPTR